MTPLPPHVPLQNRIVALDAFLFRSPLKAPRVNSFGTMTHRSALILRLTDSEGVQGWGECFANWPAFGADHRYRILTEILRPAVVGKAFGSPVELGKALQQGTRALRIQSDEQGPFDQSLAAVDIAAWDLAARQAGVPLYRALGGAADTRNVPVYASGLSLDQAIAVAKREIPRGFRSFKVKVGFGLAHDVAALTEIRAAIGPDIELKVDANQGWDLEAARENIRAFEKLDLTWVEEPIPADCPLEDFRALANLGIPIAAGENIRGLDAFDAAMERGGISVIQPDIIKWGGITGCYTIARRALERGLRYCPHYLGGGIGLAATAHLLAAVGGDGRLEFDASENPLRDLLAHPFPSTEGGVFPLADTPGIGCAPNMDALKEYLVLAQED